MFTFVNYILTLLSAITCIELFKNTTELSKCKLSHVGVEYMGDIIQTESGARCQSWSTKKPIHKVQLIFKDEMFPENSKKKAKNYCRNPNHNEKGPWCYTMNKDLIFDFCDVPLCSFSECKLTGPGMEYRGTHNRGNSGKKCLKWDKHRKIVKTFTKIYEQKKYSKRKFPDDSRGDAKNYCRNPDGNVGGPWCFKEVENAKGAVEKQFCDIPFCDDQDCMTFTTQQKSFAHYTSFEDITNFTFGLKLWNPDSYYNASATLLLSLFPLPLNAEKINELGVGIGIYLSNQKSAMTIGNKDTIDYESTNGILKSSEYTFFTLTWYKGMVTLNKQGAIKPIFLAEYETRKNLFSLNKNRFFYYSIQGTNVLWSLTLCDEEDECELHTTTSDNFERFWPLRKTDAGFDINFFIRAFHSGHILLRTSPTVEYPYVKIMLPNTDETTKITLKEYSEDAEQILTEVTFPNLVDFWEWHEFTISIFAKTIQLYWKRDIATQLIIETDHDLISHMRWFSPGSYDSVVHWTFFCTPPEEFMPPKPWPPECTLNKNENSYKGTQWITSEGHPCLPWTYDSKVINLIGNKKALQQWNYCRDPYKDEKGTYCNAVITKPETKFIKTQCKIRVCKSTECRMAGTGNDYIGKVSVTRSNRTCQHWNLNSPHLVDRSLLNHSLYADQNVSTAENFCRDPSRNIAGPWCYTTDKDAPMDLCNVRDCSKSEECTIMTRGNGEGRYIYILPQWKEKGMHGGLHFSLKEWNPDLLDGIIFEIIPEKGDGFIKFIVGADHNEGCKLYYGKNKNDAELITAKTLLHLIPAGKWGSFWLQVRRGELMLGYQGMTDPIFEWIHNNMEQAFEPMFLTYMSIEGNIIGVHFKCDECHTEKTYIKHYTRIMPIGLWREEGLVKYNNISFYLRGTGTALIPLILLPNVGFHYAVTIADFKTWVMFIKNGEKMADTLKAVNLKEPPIKPDAWTHYVLSFTENEIEVFRNNVSILKYHSDVPMLFYWFSIGAENGWVTWSANCKPPEIDGPPRDGGWSPWSQWKCTVSCGGGTGFRTRTCSNPRPNIYGKLCEGSPTLIGKCNHFECGDISPETENKMRYKLKMKCYSLVVDEGGKIVLENENDLLDQIRKESPKSFIEWTLNGIHLKYFSNLEVTKNDIVIHKAELSHSGVFICMLHRLNKKRNVLKVISLVVKPKIQVHLTRETYDLHLTCKGLVLSYVYADLSQKWLINNKTYLDYGITTLTAVNNEYIKSLNKTHDGLWKCVVEQEDLELSWITNMVAVNVRKSPTLLTHLMEDKLTAPIFGPLKTEVNVLCVVIFIVIFVCGTVAFCIYAYLKWGTLPLQRH